MNHDLTHWLKVATAQLRPQHAQRVRAEVATHYHDAVSAYLDHGKTQNEAEQAALADLGDPRVTGRALGRTYHTGRARVQRFALGLFAGRIDLGKLGLLLLLGICAAWIVPSVGAHIAVGNELTPATMQALMLQTAMCTLALSIPLFFGDLDLSLGVVVMMGALIVRLIPGDIQGEIAITPVALDSALFWAGMLGAGIGLLHGVLAVILRAPTAKITLITGFVLALILATFEQIQNLALSTVFRLTLYQPTLSLFVILALLTIVAAIGAARLKPTTSLVDQPILGQQRRDRTRRDSLQIWGGVFLLIVVILVTTLTRQAPLRHMMGLFIAILTIVTTLKIALSLSWLNQPSLCRSQPAELLLGRLLRTAVLLIPPVIVMAWFNGAAPVFFLFYAPTLFIIAAIIVVTGLVLRSPARVWLAIPAQPGFREQSISRMAMRIGSLTLCSTVAAIVGVLMCAQGIRDNTYLLCASYFVLVPLAGLIVGGQHLLTGWKRPLGAIAGALVTAAICLSSTQPSDNLVPGAVQGILLAALAAIAWGGTAGIRSMAQHFLQRQTEAEAEAEIEPSWREVRAG